MGPLKDFPPIIKELNKKYSLLEGEYNKLIENANKQAKVKETELFEKENQIKEANHKFFFLKKFQYLKHRLEIETNEKANIEKSMGEVNAKKDFQIKELSTSVDNLNRRFVLTYNYNQQESNF